MTTNNNIISEIEGGHRTRKEIAVMYEKFFGKVFGVDDAFWQQINEAIIKRWSKSGLIFIKELAWKIHDNKTLK